MSGPVIQQKHISRMQLPQSTPTTLLNSRVLLGRFLSLEPHGPAARDSQACIFCDSKHAVSISLGTVQSRANVILGITFQRLLFKIPFRLRFTMEQIYRGMRRILETNVWTVLPLLEHAFFFGIKTYIILGAALHLTPILCLRHVKTLMTPCRYYAMLERHTRAHFNVWSEASGLFCAVSLCGLLSLFPFLVFNLVVVLCCLAQSMQTLLFGGKSWLTMEVFDISSTLHARLCSLLRVSMILTNTTCGIPCWDFYARLCSLLRVSMILTNTTCGIPCWDFSVMSMLALSWRLILMRQTWGESRFLVSWLWIHCDKTEVHCFVECSIRHHCPWSKPS